MTFSKTGKSVYYGGRTFQSLKGQGFKANYFDVETGAEFWISGCKKRGGDRLYGGIIEIDDGSTSTTLSQMNALSSPAVTRVLTHGYHCAARSDCQ